MRNKSVVLLLVACVALISNLAAQNRPTYRNTDGSVVAIPSGDTVKIRPGMLTRPRLPDETVAGSRKLIIKFVSEPLAKVSKSRRSSHARSTDDEHQRFRTAFSEMKGRNAAGGKNLLSEIHFEYKTVFNGFAVSASPEVEAWIRTLPYVRDVYEDQLVKADDLTSNAIIGADKVWTDYGATGSGVVICIIDTGIDYLHPDLGGGIGAGFKVIGGYDFVNSDFDPLDDHGHGTHVAGIAAANGSIKGVAPDAKLLAFKVLGADGSGYDSWIVSAIERTVDPDQNPATDDAVDVVNMSVGRDPGGWEPYSEAIANATREGVTFVVAAGNSYGYQTVTTPGISPEAITVGATNFSDQTTPFSSKGPTKDYRIKPDVGAPGESIYSTWPNSGHTWLSGTSMASPHVAGAAALVLQKNPSWSPEMVKGALMGTAKQINSESPWLVGAGRVDLEKAFATKFMIYPASFSLGRTDGTSEVTKIFRTTIKNTDNKGRQFTLSTEGDLFDAGVIATIIPSNVFLASGGTAEIEITFNIDPSSIPKQNFTAGYFGSLVVKSDDQIIKGPVTLVHAPILRLQFSEPLPTMVLYSDIDAQVYGWISPSTVLTEPLLPQGNYDFIARYEYGIEQSYVVLAEDVVSSSDLTVNMTQQKAKHHVLAAWKDKNGNTIQYDYNTDNALFFTSTRGWSIFSNYFPDCYISDTKYTAISKPFLGTRDGVPYNIILSTGDGVDHSLDISNDPSKFAAISYEPPSIGYVQRMMQSVSGYNSQGGLVMYSMQDVAGKDFLYSVPPEQSKALGYLLLEGSGEAAVRRWQTPYFFINGANQVELTNGLDPPIRYRHDGATEISQQKLGGSLLQNSISFSLEGDFVFLRDHKFKYNRGESSEGIIRFFQTDQHGNTQDLFNCDNAPQFDFRFDFGVYYTKTDQYRFSAEFQGNVFQNQLGTARTDVYFDNTKEDNRPPVISSVILTSNDEFTTRLKLGQLNYLSLDIVNCLPHRVCPEESTAIAKVTVHFRKQGGEWTARDLDALLQDKYGDDVSDLEQGIYDMKIYAEDAAGNSVSYLLTPAFSVDQDDYIPPSVILISPAQLSSEVSLSPLFRWTSSSPSVTNIFQISTMAGFQSPTEYEVSGVEFQWPSTLIHRTRYFWRVRSAVEESWSLPFEFKTVDYDFNVDVSPTLVLPALFYMYTRQSPTFEWTAVEGATSYTISVSVSPDTETFQSVDVQGLSYQWEFDPLPYGSAHRWRVRANFGSYNGPWSADFVFYVRPEPVMMLYAPSNNSTISFSETLFHWIHNFEGAKLQISKSSDFDEIYYENDVQAGNQQHVALEKDVTFYWRVLGMYFPKAGEVEVDVISETFTLYTVDQFDLIYPADKAVNVSPESITFQWTPISSAYDYRLTVAGDSLMNTEPSGTLSTFLPTGVMNNLLPNTTYYWQTYAIFSGRNVPLFSRIFSFTTANITGTDPELIGRKTFASPNPAKEETTINIYLNEPKCVVWQISDVHGRVIFETTDSKTKTGWNVIPVNTSSIINGVYFCRIAVDDQTAVVKVVVSH